MSTPSPNGARVKILRVLQAQGMLTVSELAEFAGLTAGQARDNANHAVKDGLVTKGRDDVTNSLAYKIMPAGRAYLAERSHKDNDPTLPEAAPTCGEQIDVSFPADLDTHVDAIDATEPEPPPEQYAICRAGQAHLSAWPLRDMTIEEARQLAIDDAAAVGGEVILYRCTAIGRAFPRIVFEES